MKPFHFWALLSSLLFARCNSTKLESFTKTKTNDFVFPSKQIETGKTEIDYKDFQSRDTAFESL